MSAASHDDGEERDQPFGAGESAAQSEAETRNEAEQRDDQGDRYGARFCHSQHINVSATMMPVGS